MRVIVNGIGGRMGRALRDLEETEFRGVRIVAGCDIVPVDDTDFPVYTSLDAVSVEADCIIDFSHHTGTEKLLQYAM